MTPLAYSSNGEVTSSTSGLRLEAIDTGLDLRCGSRRSRTLSPGGTTTINCAVVPLAWGNVRPSESRADCDSVPGRLNSSSNSPLSRPAAAAEDDQHREPGQQYGAAASGGGTTEAVEER